MGRGKRADQYKKHSISFLDAEDVFDDINRMERYDVEHSNQEDRWQTLGLLDDVLFVAYTERNDVTPYYLRSCSGAF